MSVEFSVHLNDKNVDPYVNRYVLENGKEFFTVTLEIKDGDSTNGVIMYFDSISEIRTMADLLSSKAKKMEESINGES